MWSTSDSLLQSRSAKNTVGVTAGAFGFEAGAEKGREAAVVHAAAGESDLLDAGGGASLDGGTDKGCGDGSVEAGGDVGLGDASVQVPYQTAP